MSSTEDFQAKINEINTFPENKIKKPNMPIDVFLQEVENIVKWVEDDKEKLESAGLDWTLVTELPTWAGALREAQSLWFKERFTREEAEKEWKEKVPEAYDLRNKLIHDFRFAFRNNDDLLNRVSAIADGTGHADMIQDLNDLSVLGKDNTELLTAINFDLSQLDDAAAMAEEMSTLLSQVNVDRTKLNEDKLIRDKAYTLTKTSLDEIRACGQYLFWRDKDRLKGYASEYHRR